eukprot:CAMPEP_0175132360 /NCGR_PEP_ID=MMETSP0087-20121206/7032_1 /TAXON_ID=136419 /ORGANISM="Unknown Unknown, Strain D1" /LENGTH=73 /DNA_ID=CAMNT_0016414707 /DNA_START=511 /DNA_END=728 /DNA_ORIENTATION=+
MAMSTVFALVLPFERLYVWGLVPVPAWLLVAGLVAWDTSQAMGTHRAGGVSHTGHLGGAVYGAMFWFLKLRRG